MMGVESPGRAFEQRAVAVLVGPAALRAWTTGQANHVRIDATDIDALVRQFLAHAKDALHAALRVRAGETAFERETWAISTGDALLAAGDVDTHLLIEHVIRGKLAPPLRVLAAVSRVLGRGAPALMLEAGLDASIGVAILLREAAPRLPIAVATDAAAWSRWQAIPGREQAKARLRAVVMEAPEPGSGGITETERRVDDAARSAAERALSDALEAHPVSRRLFVLNHELAVRFGPRALEIDLACPTLRIAVEIDGYFHFRDADAYRRDRRKDLALQREGFFVVRLLAEDVMARLDDAVLTVHESIAFIRKEENR